MTDIDDNALTSIVFPQDGHAMTTSLVLAEKFGKQHKDVLKAIKNILPDTPPISQRNFAPSTYTDERGKAQPMFYLTRTGFAVVAMGFTGKEALAWKFKFMDAFDAMEAKLIESLQEIARLSQAANTALTSGGTEPLLVEDAARTLGIKIATFRDWLDGTGYVFPRGYKDGIKHIRRAKAPYLVGSGCGWFTHSITEHDGRKKLTLYVTRVGLEELAKQLIQQGHELKKASTKKPPKPKLSKRLRGLDDDTF